MILNRTGAAFIYDDVTYRIGDSVVANAESVYHGLIGTITEIRDGADKETENDTPDIYCAFQPPVTPYEISELEERFTSLYRHPKVLEDIALDMVIMAPEMLRILLKYGARHDMLSRELNGNCIHTLFAARKHPEAIKVLLEHGVDPNTLNEEGENILHSLINSNMQIDGNALIQLARVMVPAGLDINATDAMGRSLLYKVAECAALNAPGQAFGKPEQHELMLRTMKELIDLGADPEESSGGFPPLLDRLKNVYTPTINTELCPEVEQILREYRRKPQN